MIRGGAKTALCLLLRPDTTIRLWRCPTASKRSLTCMLPPRRCLSVYNINAFSCSAQDFCDEVRKHFEAPQVALSRTSNAKPSSTRGKQRSAMRPPVETGDFRPNTTSDCL